MIYTVEKKKEKNPLIAQSNKSVNPKYYGNSNIPFVKKKNQFNKKKHYDTNLKKKPIKLVKWRWLMRKEYKVFTKKYKFLNSKIQKTSSLRKWIRRFLMNIYFQRFLKKSTLPRIYIVSTYRNLIITVTDSKSNVLFRISSGSAKNASFKKAVRKKPFPATSAGKEVASWLKKKKLFKILIFLKGIGRGKSRKFALKALERQKLLIYGITDITSLPYNGCRKPKKRRL